MTATALPRRHTVEWNDPDADLAEGDVLLRTSMATGRLLARLLVLELDERPPRHGERIRYRCTVVPIDAIPEGAGIHRVYPTPRRRR